MKVEQRGLKVILAYVTSALDEDNMSKTRCPFILPRPNCELKKKFSFLFTSFLRTSQQPDLVCCNRSTNLFQKKYFLWICWVGIVAINKLVHDFLSQQNNRLFLFLFLFAILLETRTNELTRLSSQLHTHTICYHNDVETRGRRGQGVAIFIHNSLAGLVRMWKISYLYQAVWVYINGSVFGVRERVLLEAVYINPRSSSRTDAEISLMFSHMQHDVSEAQSESQHLILVGDYRKRF